MLARSFGPLKTPPSTSLGLLRALAASLGLTPFERRRSSSPELQNMWLSSGIFLVHVRGGLSCYGKVYSKGYWRKLPLHEMGRFTTV